MLFRSLVVEWIKRQVVNPYPGMRRYTDSGVANLWWGRIPGTYDGNGDVMCAYIIDDDPDVRRIRCDSIATLSRPNLT